MIFIYHLNLFLKNIFKILLNRKNKLQIIKTKFIR